MCVSVLSGLQKYVENVKQDTNIMTNILRVSASDEDADNNGAIRYHLTAPYDPSDIKYFDIHSESGWIFLKKPLDVSLLKLVNYLLPNSSTNYWMNYVHKTAFLIDSQSCKCRKIVDDGCAVHVVHSTQW